ncbi:Utp13 specific WD40 associated domain protein [Necator americanus]|uniref:Utp13 specific WD40 associated domain protein n=1 Tax=Necator americanus TaxID=51031 RepID=W2SQ12_NECAM|nr:Utp13 specific WD40 associated domain protein [Necator americanus]ETN71789.1 Utp13 specific WD40 associated domain protein [Necator americanus]
MWLKLSNLTKIFVGQSSFCTILTTTTNEILLLLLFFSYTIGDTEESLRITSICLDKNGSRLFVAYTNYTVREFTLGESSSNVARTWKTMHTAPILSMKFSIDGSLLATGSADHTVKIWDIPQQHCTHTLKGSGVVSALTFVQNSRLMKESPYLIIVSLNKSRILLLLKEAHSRTFVVIGKEPANHFNQVTGFVELPGFRRVVAVSRDRTASVIEIETREVLKVFPLFEAVESVILAHNGNIVTVGEEGTVKEWVISSGSVVRRKKITEVGLDFLVYNPVRDQLLMASAEENIFVVSFDDLSLKRQIVGFHDEVYACSLLGKNDSHLAVASNAKEVRLYDVETWDCQMIDGHSDSVLHVTTAPFNRRLLASCSKDNCIIIWRLTVKTQLFVYPRSSWEGCELCRCCAHRQHLYKMDKMVKLWHIDSGKMRLGIAGTLSGHRRGVADARFSPNSLILFVNHGTQLVSGDSAGIVKIWTLATSETEASIEAHNDKAYIFVYLLIWALLPNHDESEYISAGTDGRIVIWKDVSEEKKLEQEAKLRRRMEEEQTLTNFLEQGRSQEALRFALGLVRPFCALKVIDQLIDRDELASAVMKLDKQQIQTLLDFAAQWNTNSRTSLASQNVLNCILKIIPPDELLDFSNIRSVVESFIPYTKRKSIVKILVVQTYGTVKQSSSGCVATNFHLESNASQLIFVDVPKFCFVWSFIDKSISPVLVVANGSLISLCFARKMGDDLPMEDIDDMPELIDVDVPAQLPSLIEQNIVKPKEVEEFLQVRVSDIPPRAKEVGVLQAAPLSQEVSKRKRKSNTKDVEMEECGSTVAGNGEGDGMEASSRRAKKSKGEKGEMRKIPVPKHRYTPLKDNWVNIFTPVVKNLGLQIRFTKSIEFSSGIQFSIFCAFCTLVHIWAADFVRAFILGFDVADALALIRLDHLFLETFEVADVKSSLKGDNLSRAVGRIAGKDGRTKLVIENVTKTRIVLADTKIHLLGAFQNLKLARNAISSLILGAPPSKVYGNLRNLASRSSERL